MQVANPALDRFSHPTFIVAVNDYAELNGNSPALCSGAEGANLLLEVYRDVST